MPSFIRKVAASYKEQRGTRLKASSPFVIGTETIIPRLYTSNTFQGTGMDSQDRRNTNFNGRNFALGNEHYKTKLDSSIDDTNGTPENNRRQPQWNGTEMMASSTQWSYRVDAAEQQLNWGIQFDLAMMNYFWMKGIDPADREANQTESYSRRTQPYFTQGFMVKALAYNYTTYSDVYLNVTAPDDFRVFIELSRVQGYQTYGAYNRGGKAQSMGSEHSLRIGPTRVTGNNFYGTPWTDPNDYRQAYHRDLQTKDYLPRSWYDYFHYSGQNLHYGQGPAGTTTPYGRCMSIPCGGEISSFDVTRADDKFDIPLHGPIQECRFGGSNPSIWMRPTASTNTPQQLQPNLLNPTYWGPGTYNGADPNTWDGLYDRQKMEGCPSWVEFSNYHYVFRYTLNYVRQDHAAWGSINNPQVGGVAYPDGFAQERSVHDWRTLTDSTVERVHSFQWLNDGHDCYVLGYETENIGGTDYYSTYLYHFEIDSTQHNDWWDYSKLRQIEKVKIADKDGEPFGIKDVYEVANPPAHKDRTYWGNLNLSTDFLMDNRWGWDPSALYDPATTIAEWNEWPKLWGDGTYVPNGLGPTYLQLSFSVGGRYGLGIGETEGTGSNVDHMVGSCIHHFRTNSYSRSITGLFMEHDPYTSLQNEFALTTTMQRGYSTPFDPERMYPIANRVFNYKMPMQWNMNDGWYNGGDFQPRVGPRFYTSFGREVLFSRECYFKQKSQFMSVRVPTGRKLYTDTTSQEALDLLGRSEYIQDGVGAPFNQRKPTGIIGTAEQTLDKMPNPSVADWSNLPDEKPLCAIFSPDGMKFLYWTRGDNKTGDQTVRWGGHFSSRVLPVLNRVNLEKPFDLRTALMNENLDADGVPNLYRVRADEMFETNLTVPYDDVFPTVGPWSGKDGKHPTYDLDDQMYRLVLPVNMEWGNCREYGDGASLPTAIRQWNYVDGMCLITQWDNAFQNDAYYTLRQGNKDPNRPRSYWGGSILTYNLIPPTTIRNKANQTDDVFANNSSSYDIVRMTPNDEELKTRFVRNWIPLTTTTNDFPIVSTDLMELIKRPTQNQYDYTEVDPDSECPDVKWCSDSTIRPYDPRTSVGVRDIYHNIFNETTPYGTYPTFYNTAYYHEAWQFRAVRFYDKGNRALICAIKAGDSCAPDRMFGAGRWFGDFVADHDVFQNYTLEDFFLIDTDRGDQNFEVWFDCKLSEPYMLHSFAQPTSTSAPQDSTNFRNMGNMEAVYFNYFDLQILNKTTYMPTAALENFQLLDDGETLVRYRAGSFQTMRMYSSEWERQIKGSSGQKQWIFNQDDMDSIWSNSMEDALRYEFGWDNAGFFWNQQQVNTSYDPISTKPETTDLTTYNCWAWNNFFTNPSRNNGNTNSGKNGYITSFPSYLDMTEIFYKLGYTKTFGLISPNGDFPVVLCPRETSFAGWGKVQGNYYQVNNTLTSPSAYNGHIMQRVKSNPNVPYEE